MFNLGFPELMLLAVIAVVVLGPEKLPEAARTFLRLMNELKRAGQDVTDAITEVRDETLGAIEDARTRLNEEVKKIEESDKGPKNDD